jgi:hypothetical protein
MANVGGSGIPCPNSFSPKVTCYVNIYAPTTVHTTATNATANTRTQVASSSESEPAQQLPIPSHLHLVDLDKVKRKRPKKRRVIFEWLIRKLQTLLDKVD